MPELRLLPLDEVLSKAQLSSLERQLTELGVSDIPVGDDQDVEMEEVLTEDQLTDFLDRLEARDLACDIYIPVEFEGRLEVGDQGIGSTVALLEVLEELREELDIDAEEVEDEEEELDLEVIEEQLRYAWRTFLRAANTSVDKQIPLHVIS